MNESETLAAARKALADWRAADMEELEARCERPLFFTKASVKREAGAHDRALAARDRLVSLLAPHAEMKL